MTELQPVDMVLFCPNCSIQHIDQDEWATTVHRSHKCTACGYIWRVSDHPTRGVPFLHTHGEHDQSSEPQPSPVVTNWLKQLAKKDCRYCDGTGIYYGSIHICPCIGKLFRYEGGIAPIEEQRYQTCLEAALDWIMMIRGLETDSRTAPDIFVALASASCGAIDDDVMKTVQNFLNEAHWTITRQQMIQSNYYRITGDEPERPLDWGLNLLYNGGYGDLQEL